MSSAPRGSGHPLSGSSIPFPEHNINTNANRLHLYYRIQNVVKIGFAGPLTGVNAGNAGKYAVDVTKPKRIAIVDDRTAFGQGEADEFEKAVKAAGGAIVAREYTNNQAVDFRAQITSLKSKNVDLIFFGGLDSLAANFIKQMRQFGLNAQFVGGGGVRDAEFIKIAGPAAEGAMAWE